MENPIKMDDDWGTPMTMETPMLSFLKEPKTPRPFSGSEDIFRLEGGCLTRGGLAKFPGLIMQETIENL